MTRPWTDPAWLPGALGAAGVLPADVRAVFVGGSAARGWDNAGSDVDAYVVTDTPYAGPATSRVAVRLDPPSIPMNGLRADGVAIDTEYWTCGQVDQLLARLGGPPETGIDVIPELGAEEQLLLERLGGALVSTGADWVAAARAGLSGGNYVPMYVSMCFDWADDLCDDAVGQLAADDVHSAVLSARLAFGYAVEGMLARHGQIGRNPKWRARRYRAASPPELPFEEYWRLETMRAFDPASPGDWVREVLEQCRLITTKVDAG